MLERLSWAWRLVATAVCFTWFGVGGFLLWVLVFPMLSLLVRDQARRSRYSRWVIHRAFRLFVDMMRGLGVLSYEVHGLDRLQRPGLLILANHPSLIDVVLRVGSKSPASSALHFAHSQKLMPSSGEIETERE